MTDALAWLTEDPTPIYVAGGLVLAVLAAVLYTTGRGLWLFVMGGVAAAMAAAWLVDFLVVTDRERVADVIAQGRAAFEGNRVDEVLSLISPNATRLRTDVQGAMHWVQFQEVKVTTTPQIFINRLRSPKAAEAHFVVVGKVRVKGTESDNNFAIRVDVFFEWQDGRWVVTDKDWQPFAGADGNLNANR